MWSRAKLLIHYLRARESINTPNHLVFLFLSSTWTNLPIMRLSPRPTHFVHNHLVWPNMWRAAFKSQSASVRRPHGCSVSEGTSVWKGSKHRRESHMVFPLSMCILMRKHRHSHQAFTGNTFVNPLKTEALCPVNLSAISAYNTTIEKTWLNSTNI